MQKLNNYTSVVYRKVQLTKVQQNIYKEAFTNGTYVKEYSFLSTSKVKALVMLIPGNTLFIINSRTGKDIEKIAKFGEGSAYNEYEVLFEPNRQFDILEVDETVRHLLIITMEEV